MALPCFNDTCSITTNVNAVNNKTDIAVRLNPAGGLVCGTDDNPNAGLSVNVNECYLGIDANNLLGVNPADWKIQVTGVISDQVGIPDGASTQVTVCTLDVTNPDDCTRLLHLIGRFELEYQIDAGADAPYYADFEYDVSAEAAVTAQLGAAAWKADIGGYRHAGNAGTNHERWQYFSSYRAIGAGDNVTYVMTANRDSTATFGNNVSTAAAGLGASGFMQATLLPFGRNNAQLA